MSLSRKYTWCPSEPVCPRTLPTADQTYRIARVKTAVRCTVQYRQRKEKHEHYTKNLSTRPFNLTDTHMLIPQRTVSDRRRQKPCHKTGRGRRDDEVQQTLGLRDVQRCWSAGASQEQELWRLGLGQEVALMWF